MCAGIREDKFLLESSRHYAASPYVRVSVLAQFTWGTIV